MKQKRRSSSQVGAHASAMARTRCSRGHITGWVVVWPLEDWVVSLSRGPPYGAPGGHVVTNAVVPEGEVLVRRGEHVNATDGAIGKVKGLVIRPGDHCVTHVLLDEGHLWGQKMVAIPISAVKDVEDGVRLNLTKDEVRDLPPVQVDEHE